MENSALYKALTKEEKVSFTHFLFLYYKYVN
jgi:hypothetical protein